MPQDLYSVICVFFLYSVPHTLVKWTGNTFKRLWFMALDIFLLHCVICLRTMINDKTLVSLQISRTFLFCLFPGCQKETLLIAILSQVSVNRPKIQSAEFPLSFLEFSLSLRNMRLQWCEEIETLFELIILFLHNLFFSKPCFISFVCKQNVWTVKSLTKYLYSLDFSCPTLEYPKPTLRV